MFIFEKVGHSKFVEMHGDTSDFCRTASKSDQYFLLVTGYDYPDLPGLVNNNEKLGLPERLSTGVIWYFEPHGKLNQTKI
jgi:hypothetical protein